MPSPGTGPSGVPAVGIDVVDLADARIVEKTAGGRFAARVLAARERERVQASSDPDLALWAHWAAKEAAFKVVSALAGRAPVFRHARFRVDLPDLPAPGGGAVEAPVEYGGARIPVEVSLIEGTVVAVGSADGASGEGSDPGDRGVRPTRSIHWWSDRLERLAQGLGAEDALDELKRRCFRPEEARAIHSPASALVRLAVRRDAGRILALDEGDLAVVCAEGPTGRVPPRLLRPGGPTPRVGISLSHHGRWAAWAIARSGVTGGSGGSGARS